MLLQGFNIPSEGLWFWFEGVIDVFFYADLALNFFTAYEVSWPPHKSPMSRAAHAHTVRPLPICHTGIRTSQDALTGEVITDHRAIGRRYLRGWFAVDLLATFPVDYIVRAVEVRADLP
jgi:hypothetical protein